MTETIRLKKKNHAYLQVDTERSVEQELHEFMSFYVPNYKFIPAYKNRVWDGKINLYNLNTKEIYAGLYEYIKAFAESDGRGYNVELIEDSVYGLPGGTQENVDLSFIEDIPLSSKNESIRPRDYQFEAVEHALKKKSCLLLSPTASGKSLIIYLLARWYLDNHDGRILIVVPTTSLVEQMYTDFADYANQDSDFDIAKAAHRIYGGQDKNNTDQRIIISTWQSIYKMPTKWFEEFGMVVGDEAHNFKAKSLTSVLTKCHNAEYRFGTTGTLDGTQTHKLVLEGLFGPVHNVTTTKELMDEGSLASLNINVLLLKYSDALCKELKDAKYQEEIDFLVSNESRNKFIRNLALDQEGNTLVLFQYVEKHGKPLHDLIRNAAADGRQVFFVSGGTDVEGRERVRQITEKEKDAIIVASIGTFATGINIRNIHNVIFASPSKSQIRVLQSIGRGLRKADDGRDTTLYDIADDLHWKSHKNYTLNHSAERIKIYSKEKFPFKIYEISLP